MFHVQEKGHGAKHVDRTGGHDQGMCIWWVGKWHKVDMLFFFNDTATTEIYTLSLHDALPISQQELVSIKSVGAAATRIGQ